MSHFICNSEPDSGFWRRDTSHFPTGISRHLWDLLAPSYDTGAKLGFARYGSVIDHVDIARIKGRMYTRLIFADQPEELSRRRETADGALACRLWRKDREAWPGIRDGFRGRLLALARQDPGDMDSPCLMGYLKELRKVFSDGVCQHFRQQPSSTIPVGDWLLRTNEWTGVSMSEIVPVLRNCQQPSDFLKSLDAVAELIRESPEASKRLTSLPECSRIVIEQLRSESPRLRESLDSYMDEYANRLVTGFDLTDATLRELPESILAVLRSRLDSSDGAHSHSLVDLQQVIERLRERVPHDHLADFEEGLKEARTAYGLHDDDVRIMYLWPLGLMRRAMLVVGARLQACGSLRDVAHVFHTTPQELDTLMEGDVATCPTAEDLEERAAEACAWSQDDPPLTLGTFDDEPVLEHGTTASNRIDSAITFYLNQMESHRNQVSRPEWILVDGIAASPGRYEGCARVVHGPSDFERLKKGDVLVVRNTSPAYNLLLPIIGAVVTDRGGALCHSAIIAREFGIPAVVGTSQGTSLIPDGARILVDGDRGFVAVRS